MAIKLNKIQTLKQLVTYMQENEHTKLSAYASGEGDEGDISEITVDDEDCLGVDGWYDSIQRVFEENGHNYSDNEGGSLQLDIDLSVPSVKWEEGCREIVCGDPLDVTQKLGLKVEEDAS